MAMSDEEIDEISDLVEGIVSDMFNYGPENKQTRNQLRELIGSHAINQMVVVDSLGINRSKYCAELFKLAVSGACLIPIIMTKMQKNPNKEFVKKLSYDLLSDVLRHEINGVIDHYFDHELDKSTAS